METIVEYNTVGDDPYVMRQKVHQNNSTLHYMQQYERYLHCKMKE